MRNLKIASACSLMFATLFGVAPVAAPAHAAIGCIATCQAYYGPGGEVPNATWLQKCIQECAQDPGQGPTTEPCHQLGPVCVPSSFHDDKVHSFTTTHITKS